MTDTRGGVVLLSGGMDSTVLAYWLKQTHTENLHAILYDYGQRHLRELFFARRTVTALQLPYREVILPTLGDSALTTPGATLPEGAFAAPEMKATIVPNRNMVFLAHAASYAVSNGLKFVAYAAQTGESIAAGTQSIYPDCRPEFAVAMRGALRISTDEQINLLTPFIRLTKAEIIQRGERLGVPWADTWSCYKGNLVQCGRCGACGKRIAGFMEARVTDTTTYVTMLEGGGE